MLMKLLVFWILISIFWGSREANRILSGVIGIFAALWAVGLIIRIGIGLLPLILLAVVLGKILIPFLSRFFDQL